MSGRVALPRAKDMLVSCCWSFPTSDWDYEENRLLRKDSTPIDRTLEHNKSRNADLKMCLSS